MADDRRLNADDAEQLEDFADRNERAAATARRIAPAHDAEVASLLDGFASFAEQAAQAARAIAATVNADGRQRAEEDDDGT